MKKMTKSGGYHYTFGNSGARIIFAGFFGPANVNAELPYDNKYLHSLTVH
jgi:hypothetical protein